MSFDEYIIKIDFLKDKVLYGCCAKGKGQIIMCDNNYVLYSKCKDCKAYALKKCNAEIKILHDKYLIDYSGIERDKSIDEPSSAVQAIKTYLEENKMSIKIVGVKMVNPLRYEISDVKVCRIVNYTTPECQG